MADVPRDWQARHDRAVVADLPDARAITFEIEYLSEDALTGETINAATEAMMAAVAARFGDRVTLRV